MVQAKFSFEDAQIAFLNNHRAYGFKDKSSMVRAALDRLREDLEIQSLRESADLYAEIYAVDPDVQELTETAISGWPE